MPHDIKQVRRLGSFDREPFLGGILRGGMLVSLTCITVAVVWQGIRSDPFDFTGQVQGTNVLHFLLADLPDIRSITRGPNVLLHLGIAALLLTPYLKTLAALWYFASIERNRRYALCTGIVALFLTYVIFFG